MLLGEAKGVDQISNKSNSNEGHKDSSSVQQLVSKASLDVNKGSIGSLK